MVKCVRSAELIDPRCQELRRLDAGNTIEHEHFVKRPVRRALRRGAVVADDDIDQRVVENIEILQRVDEPADVMVGMFEEPGVDFHLTCEHRLHLRINVVPCGNFLGPLR